MIKLSSSFALPLPPERVFAALVDPAVLQRCIPGCEALEQIAESLSGQPLPLAVECTGFERLIDLAVQALGPGGRLVLAGTTGGQRHALDVDAVVFKEIDILGGLGQAHDTELAARIVNSRRYPVEQMVTHTFPLCEAPAAIGLFKEGRDDVIHVALDPWQ